MSVFEWVGYLELAEELAEDTREQCGRAAISRAYYAAFNHVKKRIEISESSGGSPFSADGRAHDEVHERLKKSNPTLAPKLRDLKQLRTWADYRGYSKPKLEEDVKKAITYARVIIANVK